MPRLKHKVSGAIVNVPDEKVERLGSEWAPADKPAAKKAASSSKSDDK